MNYKIGFEKQAQKFIFKQPPQQQKRILSAINKLPNEGDIRPLQGYENTFRLRVGNYRVIYTIKNEIVTISVMYIGNRGDIYKQFQNK